MAALSRGDRVELRGFGAFSIKSRPARTGRMTREHRRAGDGIGEIRAVLQDRQGYSRARLKRAEADLLGFGSPGPSIHIHNANSERQALQLAFCGEVTRTTTTVGPATL